MASTWIKFDAQNVVIHRTEAETRTMALAFLPEHLLKPVANEQARASGAHRMGDLYIAL